MEAKGKHKKIHLHVTMFGTLVLVLVLVLLFQTLKGKAEPIFDDNTTTTYYAKTVEGEALNLQAEQYFNTEAYDDSKFLFDTSLCNWDQAGVYRVPVFYDGKKTNCVVQVEVRPYEEEQSETIPNLNQNTVVTGEK